MWRRPGKTEGSSATTRDDGGLYVFSTSTEFEPEVPYSKFGALAVLEHGGDHSAAAAALRLAGYGEHATTFAPTPAAPAGDAGDVSVALGHSCRSLRSLVSSRPRRIDLLRV
jgi:hypothetical protein